MNLAINEIAAQFSVNSNNVYIKDNRRILLRSVKI